MIRLKPWTSIGVEEERAALRVLRSGLLSGHLGGVLEGGPEVQALEREWSELNGGGYSVAVNSATSGLLIALKAIGISAGDEIIVSPYSMSAGVAAVLWCGAVPVFADIGDDYCLDPQSVGKVATEKTCAVLFTNLFGGYGPEDLGPIYAHTKPECLFIEDNAQAPLTHRSYGHIMIDSFNVHKPMQAGEGGICTTKFPAVEEHMKMLRNHGELAGGPPGLNLRMTEVTAAIAREQVKKGHAILAYRRKLVRQMIDSLWKMPEYKVRPFDPGNAYYVFPIRVRADIRDRMVKDLQERGVPVRAGYGGGPLYHLPAFHEYARECPNCERIEKELIILEMYAHAFDEEIIDQIVEAFHEVAYEAVR